MGSWPRALTAAPSPQRAAAPRDQSPGGWSFQGDWLMRPQASCMTGTASAAAPPMDPWRTQSDPGRGGHGTPGPRGCEGMRVLREPEGMGVRDKGLVWAASVCDVSS